MQRIRNILMWEVLPETAIKLVGLNHVNQMRNSSKSYTELRRRFSTQLSLTNIQKGHLISYKMFDSLAAENLNMKNAFDPVL